MVRWSLPTALIALLLAGCDVPLNGERDPVDATGSADVAEPDAYAPPPEQHVESGATTAPDASHTVLKDGSGGGHDAHAIDSGAPDSRPEADAADDTGSDDLD